jgi:two-component system, OmpR family, phosphate regulon sensor histidine kinase PhoR
MSRIRVLPLLVGGTLVALAFAGVVLLRGLSAALARAGVDAGVAAAVRGALLAPLGLAALIGVTLAGLLGWWLRRDLQRLEARVLGLARTAPSQSLPAPALGELSAITDATDRLARDVAAREAELERRGSEMVALLDAVSDGILQLDPAGRIVRANPMARALLGLGTGGIGQPIATQVRHAELRRILETAAAGGTVTSAELTLDDRRLLVSGRPLDVTAAGGGGAVVAFVDLTEVRRLESVRRDFVANVSHELKTPLTSIRGYVETLLADDDLPPEMRRQFLEVAYKNADRLHRIIEDLLDLSRLESGGWRPEMHELDVAAAVEDVWSACSGRANARGITFVPPAAATTVYTDAGGLRQVLANLLDNALRHTPDGGRIEVRVSTDADAGNGARTRNGQIGTPAINRFVTFEVRDTGTGIPSDAIDRIFERFYRVDPSRSRADGGTGLGLSIVRHLVERMGGDVHAESELGKGTIIRFRLPAQPLPGGTAS